MRFSFYICIIFLLSFQIPGFAQNDTLHTDKKSKRIVTIRLYGSLAFNQMEKMKEAYKTMGGTRMSQDKSDSPGSGFGWGTAVNIQLSSNLAVGLEADFFSDGFGIIVRRSSFLYGDIGFGVLSSITAISRTLKFVGIFYPFGINGYTNPFLQLGIGFGWLEMKKASHGPTKMKATDQSPVISISGGLEISWPSSRFMSMLELGLRWLQYDNFKSTVIPGEFPAEGWLAVEEDFYQNGSVDFSGIFIRIGLMYRFR